MGYTIFGLRSVNGPLWNEDRCYHECGLYICDVDIFLPSDVKSRPIERISNSNNHPEQICGLGVLGFWGFGVLGGKLLKNS